MNLPATLPPEVIPHSTGELRRRLRNSWLNLGKEIPKDFTHWPPKRLWAAWLETLKRCGFQVED